MKDLHDLTAYRKAIYFWRARKAVNNKKDSYSPEAFEKLRDLCITIFDTTTLDEAEEVCIKIEQSV